MKIANGKLVFDSEPCTCNMGVNPTPGKVAGRKRCSKCNGTRRGPRGGRNKCGCYDGTEPDFNNLVDCGRCNGSGFVPEDRYSTITREMWDSIPMKVVREANGQFGFNESYLGIGYVATVGDYGAAWKLTDEEVLAEARESGFGFVQATKISKEDLTVCDCLAVLVTPNGYKVKAVYGNMNPADNSTADAAVKAMFSPTGLATAEAMVKAEQR